MVPLDLSALRKEITVIDQGIVELIAQRLEIAEEIGSYKKERGLPIFDARRERELLANLSEKGRAFGVTPDEIHTLYEVGILPLSRARQERL